MSQFDPRYRLMRHRRYRGDPRRDFLRPVCLVVTPPTRLRLVGPLPLLLIVRGRRLRQIGWRGLMMDGAEPFAVADCCTARDGRRFFSVQGRDAAMALQNHLVTLRRHRVLPKTLCIVQTRHRRHSCLVGDGRRALPLGRLARHPPQRAARPITFAHWHGMTIRQASQSHASRR
jgi:hypothetical protein